MVGVEHRGKAVYFIGICSGGAADGKEYLENPVELFGGGIFILLFQSIYGDAPLYAESMQQGPSAKQLDFILGKVITDSSGWSISLFLVLLIGLYFVIYLHSWKEGEYKELMYAITAPFLLFFAFSEFDFYRAIYLMPFLYILFVMHYDKIVFHL